MTHLRRLININLLLMCFSIPMVTYASATSNDFKKCHTLKDKILGYCLKDKRLKSNDININDVCQENLEKHIRVVTGV